MGTGPVYGPGVDVNVGRLSRPSMPAGRVGPVQRRVDRQQVRQVVAVGVDRAR